jgi:hypothetical protein
MFDIDRGDLACSDRDVANCIEPDRRIDHTPTFDDQIIGRRQRTPDGGEHRSTGGAGNPAQ